AGSARNDANANPVAILHAKIVGLSVLPARPTRPSRIGPRPSHSKQRSVSDICDRARFERLIQVNFIPSTGAYCQFRESKDVRSHEPASLSNSGKVACHVTI